MPDEGEDEVGGGPKRGPAVYSIAAHRGFADALVAGLIPRYSDPDLGLARLTLLLPSQRAVRIVTEAFVRLSGSGLLLPRMAVVGDLDFDDTLGPLLDPLGAGAAIPPAADPVRRWLRLAAFLRDQQGPDGSSGPALLRRAWDMGQTMDRLMVEGVGLDDLLEDRVVGIIGEQAHHWQNAALEFLTVLARWRAELDGAGEVDAPIRRNLLFDHAARRWQASPPAHPIVAAGVTSASPPLARLLRVVAHMPQGAVILPDLDLAMDEAVWNSLGTAGAPAEPGDPPFASGDAVTHPQYHLKLLLNRMGIGRDEVRPWHRSGIGAAPPARSRTISNLFLPPEASARWIDLPADQRRLSGVRLMRCAHAGEEAQAVAILAREALEVPERRVAIVTPDRKLASRIAAHLGRWDIAADDSAGTPLSQTPAGRLLLLLAQLVAEDVAPVPLIALLGHPLVRAGEGRAAWLELVRAADLALRGPRPGPGLAPIRALAARKGFAEWWQQVEALLEPLFEMPEEAPLATLLDVLTAAAEALCGEALWAQADGRSLSTFVEDLGAAAASAGTELSRADLHVVLRDAMERVSVRPPWGGHPRVAIYGLLEARMSRADLVLCCGLVEGVWPGVPKPDSLLPPAVLRALGVPGADFRIGLSAHDLAAALGAPEVVLSWSDRDDSAPVIPSRFVLRIEALLGEQAASHHEARAVDLARRIDAAPPVHVPYPRPQPDPSPEQRKVAISVTGLDRLRGDPYQFYARDILRLGSPDPLDAEPSPAWRGTIAHDILKAWHDAGQPPGGITFFAERELEKMQAHPLMRSLWRPRIFAALEWIDRETQRLAADGRQVLASEVSGEMTVRGVRIQGRADRIDRLSNGRLGIIDYKTGMPPSGTMVENGYALQLGLIGLIASAGGFEGIEGEAEKFEYWSLGKQKGGDGFGFCSEPVKEGQKKTGIPRDEFLPTTADYLDDAIDRWILGRQPFTARLNPDLGGYNDYDQLMRLDEWIIALGSAGEESRA